MNLSFALTGFLNKAKEAAENTLEQSSGIDWTAVLIAGAVMGGLAIVFAFLLGIADKKFAVKTDDRVSEIADHLGGVNCGACGYAGCAVLAEAIVQGKAAPRDCPVTSNENRAAIADIMGIAASENEKMEPKIARLHCTGDCNTAAVRYDFEGITECRAAAGIAGGPKMCSYACIGLGDCIKVCKFNAITMGENGLPVFNADKCTGCGECVKQCPRGVIELIPKTAEVLITCRNADNAKEALTNCKNACIGCGKCVKACPQGAISIIDKHSVIDYSKCIGCGACAAVCPTGCIAQLNK